MRSHLQTTFMSCWDRQYWLNILLCFSSYMIQYIIPVEFNNIKILSLVIHLMPKHHLYAAPMLWWCSHESKSGLVKSCEAMTGHIHQQQDGRMTKQPSISRFVQRRDIYTQTSETGWPKQLYYSILCGPTGCHWYYTFISDENLFLLFVFSCDWIS